MAGRKARLYTEGEIMYKATVELNGIYGGYFNYAVCAWDIDVSPILLILTSVCGFQSSSLIPKLIMVFNVGFPYAFVLVGREVEQSLEVA